MAVKNAANTKAPIGLTAPDEAMPSHVIAPLASHRFVVATAGFRIVIAFQRLSTYQ
jgi:hypothetical protein